MDDNDISITGTSIGVGAVVGAVVGAGVGAGVKSHITFCSGKTAIDGVS